MRQSPVAAVLAVIALAAVPVTPGVLAQAQTPAPPAAVRAFADALAACTPATVSTTHPLMRTFVIEHTVAGQQAGRCRYDQTMPGKMRLECAFTPEGRQAMASEIRASAEGGPMSGGTSRTQPAWTSECEIVTASGTRTPMAPAPRP